MCKGVDKCVGAICGGNLQERDHIEDASVAGGLGVNIKLVCEEIG
jgi:hypothetical protein